MYELLNNMNSSIILDIALSSLTLNHWHPIGRRISKTSYNDDDDETKKIIKYTYSNQDAIQEDSYSIKEEKEKLKSTKEYIYGKWVDDVIAVIITTHPEGRIIPAKAGIHKNNSSVYFFHKDHLNSITAITDSNWKIIEEYNYDTFWKPYIRDGKSNNFREFTESKIWNTRLFTWREYDREINLYYYRARYYSADLGRFISRDPIWTRDNINLKYYIEILGQ